MEVERGRRDLISEGFAFRSRDPGASASLSPPPHSSRSMSPSGLNSIEHRVSKLDTLAGIAIKYGVEVADIKRMNGLVTDLQMFAHKKLQIPLPGRHPPSPVLSNGLASNGEQTPPHVRDNSVMDSFKSLKLTPPRRRISDAMSSLQGYYGLTPAKPGTSEEGTEMSVYRTNKGSNALDLTLAQNHKSTLLSEDVNAGVDIGVAQGADATNPILGTPESVIEEGKGSSSSRNGKGLALRPKSGSRTDLALAGKGFASVRKSSSTPNLEDSDSHSLWSTSRWGLKTEAITRPLLEGLPRHIAFRKNKAARD